MVPKVLNKYYVSINTFLKLTYKILNESMSFRVGPKLHAFNLIIF